MEIAYPKPELAAYVKNYWSISGSISSGTKHIQRIVPDGLVSIYFYRSALPRVVDDKVYMERTGALCGQTNQFYDLELTDSVDLFAVTLKPLGAAIILGRHLAETNCGIVALNKWIKQPVSQLEDDMCGDSCFNDKVKTIEHFFLQRLIKAIIPHRFDVIKEYITHVSCGDASENINIGIGQRQLQRQFTTLTGFTIKRFERILRFQKALYIKQCRPHTDMQSLVFQCGYFDQAHMINDFKSLCGYTPGQFFHLCEPHSDYYN